MKNNQLAEFIGILLGDGNLHKTSTCITIVGSIEEKGYYEDHVIPLIKNLFEVNPKLRKRNDRNAYYIQFHSKKAMDFLLRIGMIRGNKKNARIPPVIKTNKEYITAFLRGLFDTDGCLKFSKQNKERLYYPRIRLGLLDSPLVYEIKGLLHKLEFNFSVYKNTRFNGLITYEISGCKNLERWMKEIGSNNPVQLSKYLVWKKYGFYTAKSSLRLRLQSLQSLSLNTHFSH